jgi:two-component system, NtrC family, sensor kinase
VGKGTGQGLAMAYEVIVRQHGGSIEFESEQGKGTTFTIRLPISRTGEARAAAPQADGPES